MYSTHSLANDANRNVPSDVETRESSLTCWKVYICNVMLRGLIPNGLRPIYLIARFRQEDVAIWPCDIESTHWGY